MTVRPLGSERRLGRLLAMLPWLMERGEAPLTEVAARFAMSEADVVADLELVAMCGLPPYVDEMIDVFVDEGTVFVGVPRLFTKPLRLTAPEGFTLLTAARAALELPGVDPDGALARGVAKLAAALGPSATDDDTAGVVIDLDRPPLTDELVDHVASGRVLRIEYYSPARDEITARVVTPRLVHTDSDNWYLRADDERSGERRSFRIDRIEAIEPTGEVVAIEAIESPEPFFSEADLPTVTLRLEPGARWVVEEYPMRTVTVLEGGALEATFAVASDRWIDRLLLRLGPDAAVVGDPALESRARVAAERILARY